MASFSSSESTGPRVSKSSARGALASMAASVGSKGVSGGGMVEVGEVGGLWWEGGWGDGRVEGSNVDEVMGGGR